METWLNPACSKCRTAVAALDEARGPGSRPLSRHPRAIQRPIITAADSTTLVGRDPDALAEVISAEHG